MDPDSGYNSTPSDNGANNGRKLLILGVVVLLLFAGMLIFFTRSSGSSPSSKSSTADSKQGSVTLAYKLSDTSGISVYFNNKQTKPAKGTTFNLNAGNYTMDIKKSNYSTFSTKFSLAAGQALAINVNLQPSKQSTAQISDLSQIMFLPDGFAAKATILGAPQYFYDNTWTAFQVSTPDDPQLWIVANYQPQNGGWALMADPTIVFQTDNAARLPTGSWVTS